MKAKALPAPYETATTRTVADFLDWALPVGSRYSHIPHGEKRAKATAGKLRGMGVRPGPPDFIIFAWLPKTPWHRTANAVDIWIEMKRKGSGRLSDDQKDWREIIVAAGRKHFICNTVDDVRDALISCGVVLRARLDGNPSRRAA